MMKLILIAILLTLTFASFSYGQVKSENKKSINTFGEKNGYWLTPQKMTPLSFLEIMKLKGNRSNKFGVVTMTNSFPDNWLSKKDIDTLIRLVNSKEKCNCFLNPLSSYIPNGSADVGGYSIWLIESYKQKRKVSFGLYACPKTNRNDANNLIKWWKTQKL